MWAPVQGSLCSLSPNTTLFHAKLLWTRVNFAPMQCRVDGPLWAKRGPIINDRLWTCLSSMEPRVDFSEAESSCLEDVDRPIDVRMRVSVWLACVASQSQGLSGPGLVVLSYHSDSDSDSDDFTTSRVREFMSSWLWLIYCKDIVCDYTHFFLAR
jgi:hypothetical protein